MFQAVILTMMLGGVSPVHPERIYSGCELARYARRHKGAKLVADVIIVSDGREGTVVWDKTADCSLDVVNIAETPGLNQELSDDLSVDFLHDDLMLKVVDIKAVMTLGWRYHRPNVYINDVLSVQKHTAPWP